MPTTPTGPRPVRMRQEQPLRAGQRVGAAPGGRLCSQPISPRPDRPRRACPRADSRRCTAMLPSLRQQQHDAHLQHQRDLVGGRPQQVVERRRAGELAAEEVELLGRLRARPRAATACAAHPRGEVADDDRDDGEEEQRDDVLGVGDGEGVERRQEEEIVGEHAEQAGEQRRPQAVGTALASTAVRNTSAMLVDAEELRAGRAPIAERRDGHGERCRDRRSSRAPAAAAGAPVCATGACRRLAPCCRRSRGR